MGAYTRLENLAAYRMLCRLQIETDKGTHGWPAKVKYELEFSSDRAIREYCEKIWRVQVC